MYIFFSLPSLIIGYYYPTNLDLVGTTVLKDFLEFEDQQIQQCHQRYYSSPVVGSMQPGTQCVSALISKTLKIDKSVWLKNLDLIEGLLPFTEDAAFHQEWAGIK
ncbi:hypothetical protein BDZ89DRAFT_1254674 [Hymenopellis radicata]|nr:hypothetical protein BDZ89DRAFT_1254674 [Hymenopellis radicata]